MTRKSKLTIAIATAVLAVLGATAVSAQDKYSLKSPSGIAFSDFRGYEDWAVVSSARTDEVLKVIVANPAMIKAYKAGVPGNGQPFPEGSKIAKLQWSFKKSTEAPFVVDVPDAPRRLSSSRRIASGFRTPADGDTRSSTMTSRPAR
jgi:Cytochrome P460